MDHQERIDNARALRITKITQSTPSTPTVTNRQGTKPPRFTRYHAYNLSDAAYTGLSSFNPLPAKRFLSATINALAELNPTPTYYHDSRPPYIQQTDLERALTNPNRPYLPIWTDGELRTPRSLRLSASTITILAETARYHVINAQTFLPHADTRRQTTAEYFKRTTVHTLVAYTLEALGTAHLTPTYRIPAGTTRATLSPWSGLYSPTRRRTRHNEYAHQQAMDAYHANKHAQTRT